MMSGKKKTPKAIEADEIPTVIERAPVLPPKPEKKPADGDKKG